MKYQLRKVFDCTDMPDELCRKFYNINEEVGNDTYVEWTIGDPYRYGHLEDCKLVDAWLLENGSAEDEYVLIKHWW